MIGETASSDQYIADLIENLNEISRIVQTANGIDACLDKLMLAIRNTFIFDNVVLYLVQEDESLEPRYARAIGRGRSSETDLAWGEAIANESLKKNEIIIRRDIDGDYTTNRMHLRYFIGLPLSTNNESLGSLVFVRYGGPPYQSDKIQLIKQVATHIIYLLSKIYSNQEIENLEQELRLKRLQDDFVATISHELRTPRGFIKGYATTLLREDTTWNNVTRREFLIIIDEETDRLCELIDNLLDSSRLQSGTLRMEFQPMKLATLLKDVCLRAQSLDKNQEIELDIGRSDVHVQVDPTRIAQVIENLLSNAKKYAPGSKVKITLNKRKDQALISVRDYGPGIDPDHLDHIFNRFYRIPNTTSSVRGTGLGLFICRRIIDAHDGEIFAESIHGEGSTFHISLPLDQTSGN
ncbi:MAG: ATP-binding protein [Anaerolineales bacterium]|nr:ATP-binding protein [Anaerolineales bacterium]